MCTKIVMCNSVIIVLQRFISQYDDAGNYRDIHIPASKLNHSFIYIDHVLLLLSRCFEFFPLSYDAIQSKLVINFAPYH